MYKLERWFLFFLQVKYFIRHKQTWSSP